MPSVKEQMETLEFEVKPEHIKLVRCFNLWWNNDHDGAPHVSTHRPYGNSGMWDDIAEIIGLPDSDDENYTVEEIARMRAFHEGTYFALQIFLQTGRMEPGLYRRENFAHPWARVDTLTEVEQHILKSIATHGWATARGLSVVCEIPVADVRAACARLHESGVLITESTAQGILRYAFPGTPSKRR